VSEPRLFVALVRHGHYVQPTDVPSAHLPHPLTDRGRAEADACADELRAVAADLRATFAPILLASSLRRAEETASRILARWSEAGDDVPALVQTPALAERSLGAAANLTTQEIEAIVRAAWVSRTGAAGSDGVGEGYALPAGWKGLASHRLPAPFTGAESLLEAGARCATAIESWAARIAVGAKTNTMLVVVSHGGALRHAAAALGIVEVAALPRLSMWHARPVIVERRVTPPWRHVSGDWKVRSTGTEHGL
jgi:2,3-bisphosphoglycerate-dependent phosphoglycerate mutase